MSIALEINIKPSTLPNRYLICTHCGANSVLTNWLTRVDVLTFCKGFSRYKAFMLCYWWIYQTIAKICPLNSLLMIYRPSIGWMTPQGGKYYTKNIIFWFIFFTVLKPNHFLYNRAQHLCTPAVLVHHLDLQASVSPEFKP